MRTSDQVMVKTFHGALGNNALAGTSKVMQSPLHRPSLVEKILWMNQL
jgi:hypothetical protein